LENCFGKRKVIKLNFDQSNRDFLVRRGFMAKRMGKNYSSAKNNGAHRLSYCFSIDRFFSLGLFFYILLMKNIFFFSLSNFNLLVIDIFRALKKPPRLKKQVRTNLQKSIFPTP